jgi:hypothetical protein
LRLICHDISKWRSLPYSLESKGVWNSVLASYRFLLTMLILDFSSWWASLSFIIEFLSIFTRHEIFKKITHSVLLQTWKLWFPTLQVLLILKMDPTMISSQGSETIRWNKSRCEVTRRLRCAQDSQAFYPPIRESSKAVI